MCCCCCCWPTTSVTLSPWIEVVIVLKGGGPENGSKFGVFTYVPCYDTYILGTRRIRDGTCLTPDSRSHKNSETNQNVKQLPRPLLSDCKFAILTYYGELWSNKYWLKPRNVQKYQQKKWATATTPNQSTRDIVQWRNPSSTPPSSSQIHSSSPQLHGLLLSTVTTPPVFHAVLSMMATTHAHVNSSQGETAWNHDSIFYHFNHENCHTRSPFAVIPPPFRRGSDWGVKEIVSAPIDCG